VIVSLADTALSQFGFGTVASRSTVNLGGAIHHASARLQKKVFDIGGHLLECAPADLELRNGTVGIIGVPGASVPLAAVARAARPGWNPGRPSGMEAGLEDTFYFEPETVTWAAAAHLGIVAVDSKLGQVKVES